MEDIYLDFAERLGHRSECLARIIEYAASPRQARILMEMNPSPGAALTATELGEKLSLDPRVVQDDLEDLFHKGLAFPRNFANRSEWRCARKDHLPIRAEGHTPYTHRSIVGSDSLTGLHIPHNHRVIR